MSATIFDAKAGRKRRNKGMARVIDNAPTFSYVMFHYVLAKPIGWLGKCEDVRDEMVKLRLPMPHSDRCWGANWNACIKKGLLEDTGIEVQSESKLSNGCKTHLYRRVGPPTAPLFPFVIVPAPASKSLDELLAEMEADEALWLDLVQE